MELLGLYHYWVFAILLMIGFYAVIAKSNLIKKLIGLSIFQSAVFLLYITTTALGLGIVVRIKEEYGSIEESDIQEIDRR
jgi:multicomponent Na+:H+ antiporter subunit C